MARLVLEVEIQNQIHEDSAIQTSKFWVLNAVNMMRR